MRTFELVQLGKEIRNAGSAWRTLLLLVLSSILMFTTALMAQGPGPQPADVSIDAAAKAQVIHSLVHQLQENYVFPDIADQLAKMLDGRLSHGEYDSVTSAEAFSKLLTGQMREVAHDAHLQVSYAGGPTATPTNASGKSGRSPQPDPKMMHMMMEMWRRQNYGFGEVKRLDGNIGYLKLTMFADAEQGGPTAAAAMALLAHTDALIIDLRQNMGGQPGMVDLLASYFFSADQPTHLNDLSWRTPGTTEHTLQQWWTLPYVPGTRYLGKEVYILTSSHTPSAAEEFTYDLQALKRATVVGETTWGGANPGGFVPLGSGFGAFIPRGEAINPITKTNWEGKGVEPDLKVPATDALKAAHVAAIKHLIATTTDKDELMTLQQALARTEATRWTRAAS